MSECNSSCARSVPVPEPGMRAPNFSLTDSAGNSVTLGDFSGGPVVLTFFGADWDPARAEHLVRYNELLQQLPPALDKHSKDTGNLLHINSNGAWHQVAMTDSLTDEVPLLIDREDGGIAQQYGVAGQQAVFILDGEGIVRWKFVAPRGVYPSPEEVRVALMDIAGTQAAAISNVPCPATETARGFTRRDFLATALASAFVLALQPLSGQDAHAAPPKKTAPAPASGATVPVSLNINGETRTMNLEPRVTLLDALREYLNLTGTKKGCDHGQCGACTVHLDGKRINSCLTLAVMHQNVPITTIEGLAKGDTLHPMQAAFIEHDGFQCGYCTPGQIMSAVGLLAEGHAKNIEDIREEMSGNICRCGAYPNIVAAVDAVRLQMVTDTTERTTSDATV